MLSLDDGLNVKHKHIIYCEFIYIYIYINVLREFMTRHVTTWQ